MHIINFLIRDYARMAWPYYQHHFEYLVKPISPQTLYQRIIWTIENPLQFQLIDDCYVPVHNQANHPDAFPIATQGIPDDTDGDIVIEDLDDDTNTNFWL